MKTYTQLIEELGLDEMLSTNLMIFQGMKNKVGGVGGGGGGDKKPSKIKILAKKITDKLARGARPKGRNEENTQFINELKLPKPKNRARAKEFVRGLRGERMNKDPLVGKEMSDQSGYVRGKWSSAGQTTMPPRTSDTPKYNPHGLSMRSGSVIPYVDTTLSKPDMQNLDAYKRGLGVANKITTNDMNPKQIRRLKRKEVYNKSVGAEIHPVVSRRMSDIRKPPTPRQQAISDKLNKIKNTRAAKLAGKIGSKLFSIS